MNMELEATHMRGNTWVVQPKGRCGMMGWRDGKAWTAVWVKAKNAQKAVDKARDLVYHR